MKFSIQFKYSNVTFKNKGTKETISFDTKAQDGNTFTFDNVDEDVVIGIVKGIKNKKASEVFSYDDFRTNFINTMARNKCKELYDKIDKEGWKIEDIVVSSITLKDVEFTKPTMNARENITVESTLKKEEPRKMKVYYIAEPDGDPMDSVKGLESGYYHSEEEANAAVEEFVSKNKIEDFKYKVRSTIDDVTDSDFVTGSTKKNITFENSREQVEVIFKKDKNGEIIAFFP